LKKFLTFFGIFKLNKLKLQCLKNKFLKSGIRKAYRVGELKTRFIMNWYIKVLKQYADFNGRARRKEYWMFVLFNVIFSIATQLLDGILGLASFEEGNGPINIIYTLALLVPSLAVAVRRMHDVGKSGWFILIPIYNFILAVTNGEEKDNEYGPDPKNPNNEIDSIGSNS
jgi:uncharacterized membrane protein YhaH (DUF805 family)